MEELKIKITENKLAIGKMHVALPNGMFFDGNNCDDNMISFCSAPYSDEPARREISVRSKPHPDAPTSITIEHINSCKWDRVANDSFCEMEYSSTGFPVVTNGIPGIAYYAYESPGRALTEEEEKLNELLVKAGEPQSMLIKVRPYGTLAYCASYGLGSEEDDLLDEEFQGGKELLCISVFWTITDSVPSNDYVERINELLKDKVVVEMLNSIERV